MMPTSAAVDWATVLGSHDGSTGVLIADQTTGGNREVRARAPRVVECVLPIARTSRLVEPVEGRGRAGAPVCAAIVVVGRHARRGCCAAHRFKVQNGGVIGAVVPVGALGCRESAGYTGRISEWCYSVRAGRGCPNLLW